MGHLSQFISILGFSVSSPSPEAVLAAIFKRSRSDTSFHKNMFFCSNVFQQKAAAATTTTRRRKQQHKKRSFLSINGESSMLVYRTVKCEHHSGARAAVILLASNNNTLHPESLSNRSAGRACPLAISSQMWQFFALTGP